MEPPRRTDSRRTLNRILETAVRTLSADPTASMERLADVADVHRATLYRYFPTREALISTLADRAIADGRALVASAATLQPGCSAILELAESTVAFGDRYAFLIGTDAISAAGPDPIGLVSLMAAWQAAGILRADMTPEWLAAAFTALAEALYTHDATHSRSPRPMLLTQTFLYGAGPKED